MFLVCKYVYWAHPGWCHKIIKETIGELNGVIVMKDQYTEFSWGLICGEAAVRSGEKNQASGYQIYIKASAHAI